MWWKLLIRIQMCFIWDDRGFDHCCVACRKFDLKLGGHWKWGLLCSDRDSDTKGHDWIKYFSRLKFRSTDMFDSKILVCSHMFSSCFRSPEIPNNEYTKSRVVGDPWSQRWLASFFRPKISVFEVVNVWSPKLFRITLHSLAFASFPFSSHGLFDQQSVQRNLCLACYLQFAAQSPRIWCEVLVSEHVLWSFRGWFLHLPFLGMPWSFESSGSLPPTESEFGHWVVYLRFFVDKLCVCALRKSQSHFTRVWVAEVCSHSCLHCHLPLWPLHQQENVLVWSNFCGPRKLVVEITDRQ